MSVNWIWNRCARQKNRIALLVSGVLPDRERAELEEHLAQCPVCRSYRVDLEPIGRALTQAGGMLPNVEPPPGLSARWREAVRAGRRPAGRVTGWLKVLWGGATILGRAGGIPRPATLLGRRMAWAGLTTVWSLILFLKVTAPDVDPSPAGRVGVWPQAVRRLIRAQDESMAQWDRAGEGEQYRRVFPLDPPSPRSRRENDLYQA